MKQAPKITIIIPIYNAAAYLGECLESINRQTLKDIEIVCIDDGSTDASLAVTESFAAVDPRYRIIKQDNKGSGAARNIGMKIAEGEYLIFMDSDDWYPSSGTLQSLYSAADENNALICGGNFANTYKGVLDKTEEFKIAGFIKYADYQSDYGFTKFIYKREFILANKISFPEYRLFEDPPFFVKAMYLAGEFFAIPEVTYCQRYGHQDFVWSERKTIDAIKGLADNLEQSSLYKLRKLHHNTILRFEEDEYMGHTLKYIAFGSRSVFQALIAANAKIDYALLQDSDEPTRLVNSKKTAPPATSATSVTLYDKSFLLKPLEQILQNATLDKDTQKAQLWELANIKRTASYKIGRAITFIPRMAFAVMKSVYYRGFVSAFSYYMKRIKAKLK